VIGCQATRQPKATRPTRHEQRGLARTTQNVGAARQQSWWQGGRSPVLPIPAAIAFRRACNMISQQNSLPTCFDSCQMLALCFVLSHTLRIGTFSKADKCLLGRSPRAWLAGAWDGCAIVRIETPEGSPQQLPRHLHAKVGRPNGTLPPSKHLLLKVTW
jgi:hypothetical protein